ncbi:HAD family phosphatase [Nostoc sp. PCC 7107]|uniref:HAD family hydrolase n=1 Tax=Nostoc sp. PCC 7107 TaxID=317936 RepID=UPI00029F2C36|nr:HAD family phosphatase [Nostoc sp. PCC 7107]AFY42787.1 HAD-superfamily hydrolase, subfamily IA, variant 3 [Nostoc sp. PCC 7107]
MSVKAILFDFNGVIINDEHIHLQLIDEILIQENLQPQKLQERQTCLGRSDRACFQELLANRGRVLTEESLNQLLSRKAEAYLLELEKLEKLPIYAGVEDLIYQVRSQNINLGLVSGALSKEIEFVLQRTKLTEYFKVIVAGDDITTSKPHPEGYLLAVERFNQKYPELNLQPQECLAIEDTFAGIQAAKQSQMKVVGVANTYPFHMLQRCCNWTVDYLSDLELERVQNVFSGKEPQPSVSEC